MDITINEAALQQAVMEIKLFINKRLYEKDAITKEMFTKAREAIVNGR